jgi:hypothetical protein
MPAPHKRRRYATRLSVPTGRHFSGNLEFLRHRQATVYGAVERVPVGKMLSDGLCEDCKDRARYQSRRRHQFMQEERAPPVAVGLVPFEDWTPGQHLPDTMVPWWMQWGGGCFVEVMPRKGASRTGCERSGYVLDAMRILSSRLGHCESLVFGSMGLSEGRRS